MRIKFEGLNIEYEKGKPLCFMMTREAVKEFCRVWEEIHDEA